MPKQTFIVEAIVNQLVTYELQIEAEDDDHARRIVSDYGFTIDMDRCSEILDIIDQSVCEVQDVFEPGDREHAPLFEDTTDQKTQ